MKNMIAKLKNGTGLSPLILLLFVLNLNSARAQVIKPLGGGIKDTALAMCTDGKKLYVATNRPSSANHDEVRVWVWDGVKWSGLPSFTDGYSDIRSMTFFNNELYLGGSF